jgi:hypothetical protein
MSRDRNRVLRLAVAASLAACAGSALAASGTFTFVTGEVSVVRPNGQRMAAQRGTDVDPGDTIITGANGMAQLTMIDQARLSLRPGTQFRIEEYQRRADTDEGAVLSLLRGTLRTFTGLIASKNRDKFVMKTRVATVGIRGSGNILYACSVADKDCDPSVTGLGTGTEGDFTVNHTIEGSHAVANFTSTASGVPAQQGGAQTLITGPGQTVMVQGSLPPRYIPTPTFISDTATNPTGAPKTPASGGDSAQTRDFAPGETQTIAATTQVTTTSGNLGPGFTTIDASNPVLTDNSGLNDVVISANGAFGGQSNQVSVDGTSTALRGYVPYPGTLSTVQPAIVGGSLRENHAVSIPGGSIYLGRWEGAGLGFSGPGSQSPVSGNIHWIYGPSGYPTYLSDVLTGNATYTIAQATAPTNQNNTAGTLSTGSLSVNFTNRTLDLSLIGVAIPAAGPNAGGSWNATAQGVPFTLNAFFASTSDRLRIVNGSGQSSATNSLLSGNVEGGFSGTGLQGALLAYGISDFTSTSLANHNSVSGAVAFTGPSQDAAAPFREGRVSDPGGYLANAGFSRNFATTDRPDEVTADAQGAASRFVAPHPTIGARATYALGSAQVVQSGIDPETGLIWGRWGNGVATLSGNGQSTSLPLTSAGLHYVFAGSQQGPTQLPLTGTGVYDVIGSTSPTDNAGHTGTLGSATLQVNFDTRMAASTVNVALNGQTWIGSAPAMPIYRDQYFSASTGSNVPGAGNVSALTISCSPSCGQGATGSFDGFFAGRNGQRAGMLYNMGGVQGAIAFGRRAGGG